MLTNKRVAVVGSREFKNYAQLSAYLKDYLNLEDELVSGGAAGADSFAQRYAKDNGHAIHIYYPRWEHGKSAGFIRNRRIVENSDVIICFYAKGRFQQGGTANTAFWANELGKELIEIEEFED